MSDPVPGAPRAAKIRLYLEHPLGAGQQVPLPRDAAHYLFGVMRLGPGDAVALFNGVDGEWRAAVTDAGKRGGVLTCLELQRPQGAPPDLWLLFAPVKKARTDFIIEKAIELGVARLCPVLTDHTNSERLNMERLAAHIREAAEQCGATWLAAAEAPQPLARLLAGWDPARALYWADEAGAGQGFAARPGPGAVLIGPEGGFSPAERARLLALPFVTPVSLGPRILRAETAAVAALALWQARAGDWA
jgi:16S rRNA (uracil1498-N3)-methyltransferase